MGYYSLLFVIPFLTWVVISGIIFKYHFSYKEMALQAVITVLLIYGIMQIGFYSQVSDTKIVNGVVTQLNPVKKSCDQYWRDYPDSFCTNQHTRIVTAGIVCHKVRKTRSCHQTYKTQYRSVYSWERRYFVKTDIKSNYEISREDRQGVVTPKRFMEIKINDPVSDTRQYTNYIRGSSDTLFKHKLEVTLDVKYPSPYDYYHINRVFYEKYKVDSSLLKQWNKDFEQLNTNIRKKDANVILFITGNQPLWAEQLAQTWEGHNINDVIVVIGMEQDKIKWVDVRSWSKTDYVNVSIRDEIMSIGSLDESKINKVIEKTILANYNAKPMSDFEYLADDIPPPLWVIILITIIVTIVSPLITMFFVKNEIL